MSSKRGYEFGFGWIFAVIVGGFIIFLAVYATTRLVATEKFETNTLDAKQIGILLTPVETALEDARFSVLSVPREIELFNDCLLQGDFGRQDIRISGALPVGENRRNTGATISFKNKYLFSSPSTNSENELYVLSKPFFFPFKVADILILWSDQQEYCFVFDSQSGTQGELKTEFNELKLKNIVSAVSDSDCPAGSTTVCFGDPNCDVNVNVNQKKVEQRDSQPVYYSDVEENSLLLAAIFSDAEIYECQLRRLMSRGAQLAELYRQKSLYLTAQGCSSGVILPSRLESYRSAASGFSNSQNLQVVEQAARALESGNEALICKLF